MIIIALNFTVLINKVTSCYHKSGLDPLQLSVSFPLSCLHPLYSLSPLFGNWFYIKVKDLSLFNMSVFYFCLFHR